MCTLQVRRFAPPRYMQFELVFIIGNAYYSQEKGRVKPLTLDLKPRNGLVWGFPEDKSFTKKTGLFEAVETKRSLAVEAGWLPFREARQLILTTCRRW